MTGTRLRLQRRRSRAERGIGAFACPQARLPPPGPPRALPPRRPHTPAERVTLKPPDQRRSVDISLGGSPRKAWGPATKVRLWRPCRAAGGQAHGAGASRGWNTNSSNTG